VTQCVDKLQEGTPVYTELADGHAAAAKR
jgi:hypothetical protein